MAKRKTRVVWYAEDQQCTKEDAEQYGYAETKDGAERIVAQNRGYDDVAEAISDDWLTPAVKLIVPEMIAKSLIAFGETFL